MFPYLIMFSMILISNLSPKRFQRYILILLVIFLMFFVGFRKEVGGDWNSYLTWFDRIKIEGLNFSLESMMLSNFGYNLLNALSSKLGWGIYGVNFICAGVFLLGLYYFLRELEYPLMGLLIAYPYLIMVVGMGYTRQSVAIGLTLASLISIKKNRNTLAFFLIVIAITFHKTAAIALLYFIFSKRRKLFLSVFTIVSILSFPFLIKIFQNFYSLYVENPMVSFGGKYRALMNFLPAILWIVLRKTGTFGENYGDEKVWDFMSFLAAILSLFAFANLTFGDRMLLYFYSIQMVFYDRLKSYLDAFQKPVLSNIVTIGYLSAMIIWMFFGVHAESWIPYNNLFME